MKNQKTFILFIFCLSSLLFTSCESHESAADDAFEEVKKGKENLDVFEENLMTNDTVQTADKIKPVAQKTNSSDWTLFEREIEQKILVNESKIKDLKSSATTSRKNLTRVLDLEKENLNFRQELMTYKHEEKIRMETFKLKMNQEISSIDVELKSMTQVSPK